MRPKINAKLDELDEEIRPMVEDLYLANRSAASYFQERANDIERLRHEATHIRLLLICRMRRFMP